MRLDKFLAEAGIGSRSEVKQLIRKKAVTVDGQTAVSPEQKLRENDRGVAETVCVNGKAVFYSRFVYYMLNKPAGYVSSTEDPASKTVTELVPSDRDVFPVGRLDKDTEGLCILTNDGALAHRLLSPGRHVEKRYYAEVDGELTDQHVQQFRTGIVIRDKNHDEKPVTLLPAELRILSAEPGFSRAEVTIYEGKYHQIKRMFAAVGCGVLYLKRLSMGGVGLDGQLQPGAYRPLTDGEIAILKNGGKRK